MTDEALLIGYPSRLSPTAIRQTCCRCLSSCWVTPESLKAAEATGCEVKYGCILCAPVLMPRGIQCQPMTEGRLAELRSRGIDVTASEADEEIAGIVEKLGRVTN